MTVVPRTMVPWRSVAAAALLLAAACGSGGGQGPAPPSRSYYMGFSDFPPAPDTMLSRRTIEMWISRADAAIMHLEVPWNALLAGGSSDSLVLADVMPLVNAYRTIGFDLAAFGLPPDDPQVAPFARIGLVDTTLAPKPSLAVWDSVIALPLTQRLTSRVASVQRPGSRVARSRIPRMHP